MITPQVSKSLLARATRRYGVLGAATYATILSFVVLALAGTIGLMTRLPWLFPSLGPTVMLFFESPTQASARPLNTLVGHGVGIVVGIGSLVAFGLLGEAPATIAGLSPRYLFAASVSVAVTTLVLTLIKLPHPPAGASTLIISLGILTTPQQLLSMAGAVVLITAIGWGLNLLLGTRPSPLRSESQRD
jgi:HPP family